MRLLWWTLAVVSVSTLGIVLSQNRTLDPVQNLSLTVSAPLESGLADLAEPVADFFEGVFDRGDLKRENKRLREELEALQAQAAAAQDAQRRVQELEEALDVTSSRSDEEFVVADVIARDPSAVKRALAVNRGRADGLDEGMVVLSKSGSLVGTISRVYEDFSWLRLTTDPNSAVNVVVLSDEYEESAEARGIAAGDLDGALSLEIVPIEAMIAEGDAVVTSGLGGNYPRALLLGSVKSVEARPQGLFKKVAIEPSADLGDLDTVLVISSFLPARLTGP